MENGDGKVLKEITSRVDQETSLSNEREPDNFGSSLARLVTRSKKTESSADRENEDIIGMRKVWSGVILALIIVIVVFDMVLVWLYGRGVWKFDDSKVVIAVITENFLKIFTLGYIITRNLFKKIFDMNQDSTIGDS